MVRQRARTPRPAPGTRGGTAPPMAAGMPCPYSARSGACDGARREIETKVATLVWRSRRALYSWNRRDWSVTSADVVPTGLIHFPACSLFTTPKSVHTLVVLPIDSTERPPPSMAMGVGRSSNMLSQCRQKRYTDPRKTVHVAASAHATGRRSESAKPSTSGWGHHLSPSVFWNHDLR